MCCLLLGTIKKELRPAPASILKTATASVDSERLEFKVKSKEE